jgi:AcrR family transcriptional regulator
MRTSWYISNMYHEVHIRGKSLRAKKKEEVDAVGARCLAAFIAAGSLDLSLDRLALRVGVSKRMLIHYFGSREGLEQMALALLEERLRARFQAAAFPPGATLETAVMALWDQTTAPEAIGTLRVVMDATRRAWSGSARAQAFYAEQQRLWTELLSAFLPFPLAVEELLLLFQGAVLIYLATGDRDSGRHALARFVRRLSNVSPPHAARIAEP